MGKNIIYEVKGHNIDYSLSLKKNNIINDSIISMKISDSKKINVIFISVVQKTKISISCYDSNFFIDIEGILYQKAPAFKNEYYFLWNGKVVNKYLTLFENGIKDKNIVIINDIELEEDLEYEEYEGGELFINKNIPKKLIIIIFKSADQEINIPISCYPDELFLEVEKKLILDYPESKNKNLFFICNGQAVNRYATLEENKIRNGSMTTAPELM